MGIGMRQYGNPGGLAYGHGDQEVVFAVAHGDLSAGDVVAINQGASGLVTAAIPSAKVMRVGVAVHDVASAAVGQFVVKGVCRAAVYVDGTGTTATTAGKALECDTSYAGMFEQAAGAPSTVVFIGDPAHVEFGVILVAGTDSTADSVVYLHGEAALSTS